MDISTLLEISDQRMSGNYIICLRRIRNGFYVYQKTHRAQTLFERLQQAESLGTVLAL